ncbi:MAG: hypothetical protein WAT81_03540 [Candidatus Moraniibacteriota bacterium]
MQASVEREEERSLKRLLKFPHDGSAQCFVGELMLGLSAAGVTELWYRYELDRRFHLALGRIHWHSSAMARFHSQPGRDGEKARAYRRISTAVSPSPITGSLDHFWYLASCNYASWHPDGYYQVPFGSTYAAMLIERDFESDYASLIWRYAAVIEYPAR